jgi:hypothetical protein|tara:strand:+ start:224 stop:451 length:228 start_codon:yes stop_codon:yes gene_type:complete
MIKGKQIQDIQGRNGVSDVAQWIARSAHNRKGGGSNPSVAIMVLNSNPYHCIISTRSQDQNLPFAKAEVAQWKSA